MKRDAVGDDYCPFQFLFLRFVTISALAAVLALDKQTLVVSWLLSSTFLLLGSSSEFSSCMEVCAFDVWVCYLKFHLHMSSLGRVCICRLTYFIYTMCENWILRETNHVGIQNTQLGVS